MCVSFHLVNPYSKDNTESIKSPKLRRRDIFSTDSKRGKLYPVTYKGIIRVFGEQITKVIRFTLNYTRD